MNEEIEKVKSSWASFYDWVDYSSWKNLYGREKKYDSILIIRFKEKNLSIEFVQDYLMYSDYFWFGNFLVLNFTHDCISTIVFDVNYRLRKKGMKIDDEDIMFFSYNALSNIQKKKDILKLGRLILLEKEDHYKFTQIDKPDDKEFASLLYAASRYRYFGFEGIKRIIDIIEYKQCYDALYVVITNGLSTCYPCFDYILSYLEYLSDRRDYVNLELLRLLIIDSRYKNETERVEKIIRTFPKYLSLEDREIDIGDVHWKTKHYLKI
jgi:hypothetical protein